MKRVVTLAMTLTVLVLVAAPVAQAQDQQQDVQDVVVWKSFTAHAGDQAPPSAMMFERPIDVMMAEPFDLGEPVTGAPYSADITTEIVQVLADGNRIERTSTSSVARDGEGRVRRTQRLTAIGPVLPQGKEEIVTINDPVAKTHYWLDAERKVAMQSSLTFTKRIETLPAGAAGFTAATVAGSGPREARTESLGTRDFEGVAAEGTRSVITIAAGAIGNQAPIEIVSERWYSSELQTVVYTRRSDPRFGDTIYRLENIIRTEPAPELFQVPSDYTIQSGPPAGAGIRIERRIER